MAAYDYIGLVAEVGETQSFDSGFSKRDIVVDNDIESENRYPNPVKFTFKRMNCSLLDGIRKGQRVKVHFLIDGRRWDGPRGPQYFVDLTGTKIEVMGANGPAAPAPAPAAVPPPPPPPSVSDTDEYLDDVPF